MNGIQKPGLQFERRHLMFSVALLALVFAGLFELHVRQLRVASADISRLQMQRIDQQRKLDVMERQTQALQRQNTESERSIERIERTLGTERDRARADAKTPVTHAALRHDRETVAVLAARLQTLERAAAQTRAQTGRLAHLAARVLSFRRLASLARQRMIAAIPSLNPVNGEINAAFGYRTDPFPEFHKGLDLAARYGTTVHAAAAGLVASAGWAGDFGIRVDIDHGNGYHTWYCHLSRIVVRAGQQVKRGEPIAAVGSTGESTGPHLHYQVMHDGIAIDPMPFLHGIPRNVLATLPANSGVQ